MDPRRRRMALVSVAAAVGVIWTGNWISHRLIPTSYPGVLAYRPTDDMPPPVDLASVQRGWPNSLDNPGERRRLVAFLHDPTRQAAAPTRSAAVPAAPVDLGTLLAGADANAGKTKFAVCVSCHDVGQGGPNRIGPNLWGVIGRRIASHPGFSYSPAMTAQHGGWTYERLFAFLASPASAVPGTKMGFAGMARPEDRAALIKYIATIAPGAPPFPPALKHE